MMIPDNHKNLLQQQVGKFTLWFVKKLNPQLSDISDFSSVQDPVLRTKVGMFEGWFSTILNVILFIIKLFIALAINSITVLADAFHTFSDSLSSLIIVFSSKVIQKAPDEEHPYGHGRAEYIATLILSMLIVVTGVEFIRTSFSRISSPEISMSTPLLFGMLLGTVFLKEVMARIAKYLGVLIQSDLLIADAWHHRSDVFSSILPLLSMVLANFGWGNWDGIFGIGVGGFIVWVGYSLSRQAIDSLLGKPPTQEYLNLVKSIVIKVNGVLNVHDIIVHSYGHDQFISLHLEIDENVTQLKAHDIAEEAMNLLKYNLNANVIVHMDPVTSKGKKVEIIKSYLDKLVADDPLIESYHDFRLVHTVVHHIILLDLSLSTVCQEEDQERVKKAVAETLKDQFPEFDMKINVILPIHKF